MTVSLTRNGIAGTDRAFEHYFHTRLPLLFRHFQEQGVTPDMYYFEWSLTLFVRYLPLDVSKQASTPTDSLTLSLSLFFSLSLSSFFHCISCPPPRMHACMQTCIHISDFSILTNTLDTIQFLPSIPHQLMHRPMHQKVCMRIWDSYLLLGEAFFVRAAVS